MKLSLLRLGACVALTSSKITTLQIENRSVFARVVCSLSSESGEDAIEPYQLVADDGKTIKPKKALLLVESLASLPLGDRALVNSLHHVVCTRIENDEEVGLALNDSMESAFASIFEMGQSSWGKYDFALEWNPSLLLKAFDFKPRLDGDASLLDKAIAFFELCADIHFDKPIVLVNVKSFFAREELEILFEQAIFCGIQLLLLESWKDECKYEQERKTIIDQYLLVS